MADNKRKSGRFPNLDIVLYFGKFKSETMGKFWENLIFHNLSEQGELTRSGGRRRRKGGRGGEC